MCQVWARSETGKRTQLLKQCKGAFTEEGKRAYGRVFRNGDTPNKNSKAKALQLHMLDDKDEELQGIRRKFE